MRDASRIAFLVGLRLPEQPGYLVDEHLEELAELASSAGFETAGRAVQSRRGPDSRTFIGKGKATEIGTAANHLGADLVVFDDDLTPSQVKNLEKILEVEVIDRSALILEIFFRNARTREARTQVELAQLNYMLPRLTRKWTHLSRQVGGIGVRGGEGETQLEVDRRMMRQRIAQLRRDLEKIERTRQVQRKGRRHADLVALAGYTNAGKSTLFNRLTRAGTKVEDRLFATLDSKLRRGSIGNGRVAVFSDTVGFIRKLPHHLVASFRSTLEEITLAGVVLHVIDRSHPQWEDQKKVAEEVLTDLGIATDVIVCVFNKSDRLGETVPANGEDFWISALNGTGIEELKAEIVRRLVGRPGTFTRSTREELRLREPHHRSA
ncbi:MAG: GTPase HflX [Thermoanaerobaculia bacterium]